MRNPRANAEAPAGSLCPGREPAPRTKSGRLNRRDPAKRLLRRFNRAPARRRGKTCPLRRNRLDAQDILRILQCAKAARGKFPRPRALPFPPANRRGGIPSIFCAETVSRPPARSARFSIQPLDMHRRNRGRVGLPANKVLRRRISSIKPSLPYRRA